MATASSQVAAAKAGDATDLAVLAGGGAWLARTCD
jgi:hypothetical protein